MRRNAAWSRSARSGRRPEARGASVAVRTAIGDSRCHAYWTDRRHRPGRNRLLYYRGLIERHAASGIPLELTIAHADVPEMSRNLTNRDPGRQAEIFARLVHRMKAAGAAAAAVTSMGGHFCVKELVAISPLPILNAIPECDAAITRSKLKKVGIIGTRTVMESGLYRGISSAEVA